MWCRSIDGWSEYYTYLASADRLDQWLSVPGVQDQLSWCNIDGRSNMGCSIREAFIAMLSAPAEHFPDARTIIEFGCGVGRNVMYLKRELPQANCSATSCANPVSRSLAQRRRSSVRKCNTRSSTTSTTVEGQVWAEGCGVHPLLAGTITAPECSRSAQYPCPR